MPGPAWTSSEIRDQSGRLAVITGANAGIGLATAAALAAHGATVVLGCRDPAKGEAAADRIARAGVDPGSLHVVPLNLASLSSVRAAAGHILSAWSRLDLLINNAGVMAIPFELSEDGVELTFATNHLGHFALTGLLLGRLLETPSSRVITVSSNAHRRATPQLGDLGRPAGHDRGAAYDRSKLANLLFTFELQRRLAAARASTIAVAAHPGNARTGLWRTSSWLERLLISPRLRRLTRWLAQSPEAGAQPTLRAATDPTVAGGEYFGPSGRWGCTGAPVRVQAGPAAHDARAQRHLWELSQELSGVAYALPGGPAG
jgi:NAD(P)-dependent dehydrogenase (short-subunit alcohol dehydrogenase family)